MKLYVILVERPIASDTNKVEEQQIDQPIQQESPTKNSDGLTVNIEPSDNNTQAEVDRLLASAKESISDLHSLLLTCKSLVLFYHYINPDYFRILTRKRSQPNCVK